MSDLCRHCLKAAIVTHGQFDGNCIDCLARIVSRGPDFDRVRLNQKQDKQYIDLINRMGLTHAHIKKAYQCDAYGKSEV